MDSKLEGLVERGVQALEALAKDPVIEIEAGPPVCPACGVFNPTISTDDQKGSGPMFEFLIQASCNSCGQRFYALPQVWQMFLRREEVEAELQQRRGNGN